MDRYRVDRVLGEGSFGKAILCTRNADNKACVVKQVDASKLSRNARETVNREATVLAKFSHPNIVGFWESFSHGLSSEIICIVMEYADGGDLHSFLQGRKGRLLEEETVLDWFLQTTLALKHIHDRKILHRDLKTQNIFLTQSKVVKLGDFGIAKDLENTCELAPTAVGTPYYMSPEMCKEKSYDHKTDVWSLGCVLYEMTSLRHPFDGRDMQSLVLKICAHEPRPISFRYSAGLRTLLGQLLKKNPRARPSPEAISRRPLMKGRIQRFLSDAQIEEELGESFLRNPCPAAATAAGVPRARSEMRPTMLGSQRLDPTNTSRGVQGPSTRIVGVVTGAKAMTACDGNKCVAKVDTRNRSGVHARRGEDRAKVKERGQDAALALRIVQPSQHGGGNAGRRHEHGKKSAKAAGTPRASNEKRAQAPVDGARVVARGMRNKFPQGALQQEKRATPTKVAALGKASARWKGVPTRKATPCEGGVQTGKGHLPGKAGFPVVKRASPRMDAPPDSRRSRMKPVDSCPPDSNCPKVLPRSLCPPTKGDQTVAPPSAAAAAAAAKASGGDATEGPFISPFARGKDENAGLDEAKARLILAKRRQAARAVFGSAFDKRQEKDEQVLLVDRKQDPRKASALRMGQLEIEAGSADECVKAQEGVTFSTPQVPELTTWGEGDILENKVHLPSSFRRDLGVKCDKAEEGVASSTTHTPEPRGLGLGVNVQQKATPPAGRRFGLAVEGSWFETLEAEMEAINKQMDEIKTPVFSTLRRRRLGAKDHAKMREEVDTVTKKAPRVDPREIVIVQYDPKKEMPWKEDACDVEDYLAGSRARRPTLLLQVEARSTPMPLRVKGRKSWDAIGVHQSEIEPFRPASVALPAELERPCETSGIVGDIYSPSPIERQRAIRSTRDRERASLRAMIAQRRKACTESKGRDLASGAGKEIKSLESAWRGSDWLREPCGWLTASPISPSPKDIDERVAAASEPPQSRRSFRSPNRDCCDNGHGVLIGGRNESNQFHEGDSVDAPRRQKQLQTQHKRRHVESKHDEGRVAASAEAVAKDPTRRRQELRSFIARARRKCRTEQSDLGVMKGEDVSVGVPLPIHLIRDATSAGVDLPKEVLELENRSLDSVSSGSTTADAWDSLGMQATWIQNAKPSWCRNGRSDREANPKGAGLAEDAVVSGNDPSVGNGGSTKAAEADYHRLKSRFPNLKQEELSVQEGLLLPPPQAASGSTSGASCSHPVEVYSSLGAWERVDVKFRQFMAGEDADIVDGTKSDGSCECFRRERFGSSGLEYTVSRPFVCRVGKWATGETLQGAGMSTEDCCSEQSRHADVSLVNNSGKDNQQRSYWSMSSELRGINLFRSRTSGGDLTYSSEDVAEAVKTPPHDVVAETHEDDVAGEMRAGRGDARGACQMELKASQQSGFRSRARDRALNFSCEVRPSAQTPEIGRERLTRFAEVKSVDTIGETERGMLERLRKERGNDRPSEALS